eukprot:8098344-Lingulodinium_polyedra.AAC.1
MRSRKPAWPGHAAASRTCSTGTRTTSAATPLCWPSCCGSLRRPVPAGLERGTPGRWRPSC